MKIGILGAGAFGTALAISLSTRHDVTLFARNGANCTAMAQSRQNEKLPSALIPPHTHITDQIDQAVRGADYCLITCPLRSAQQVMLDAIQIDQTPVFIACAKGIEPQNFYGAYSILRHSAPPCKIAVLSGPGFATDIAKNMPTALILASHMQGLERWQADLSTRALRLYASTDPIGVELGGALKNVNAIACGAAIGGGFGESARAAIMTRGFAEMQSIAAHLGARPETLVGLSGFGDLCLTCTSPQSRNYQYGHALGAGIAFNENLTVEGKSTAQAIAALSTQKNLDTPITQAIAALTQGHITVKQIVEQLMQRPLKKEQP